MMQYFSEYEKGESSTNHRHLHSSQPVVDDHVLQNERGALAIAILGIAFRFPGDITNENDFWELLSTGGDAVGVIGQERWATDHLHHPKRSEPGRSITFAAGLLSHIDQFDAGFFNITPREAAWLDPQQRLLLEMAWEAMENAGQTPSRLAGTDCAVYVGISSLDYGIRGLDDLSGMTAHSMTGNTASIAANRLSYFFDLHGPSMAIDTACSSSLVALHQACRALEAGDASCALVGGINILLHPYSFVGFTKAAMLAADGRCKAFDASGNGYVRAEGGAMLLLKPLAQAEADGDPIQAVILATGVNADGSRKTGITIPSQAGQVELLRRVLARAGVAAADVDYVETHGTGTAVGDPVEAAALGGVFGCARVKGQPLAIGSVKTNLGHLEPASGMAGLVKTVLALKRGVLPPSIHLNQPNPHIDFAALNLRVVTELSPLAVGPERPLVMGVNSFGFGGANAHVLLQEYRSCAVAASPPPEQVPPLFLSARSEAALRELARRYGERLVAADDYYDITYSAAFRREWLDVRLAALSATARGLTDFAEGGAPPEIIVEQALTAPAKVAFIYSGNGSQWLGMGQRLMAECSRFVEILGQLEEPIRALTGFSINAELQSDPGVSRLEDTGVAQPLLFVLQVAVTLLLRERGIKPAAVAGHSVGEVAAAWAAGALSLDQAITLICARSAAQALTMGSGRMAAVGLGEPSVHEFLAAAGLPIEVAGINSPNSVTLSGTLADLECLRERLEGQGVFFRLLDLDYAFHSRFMDPIRGTLLERLGGLAPGAGGIPLVSTVTGGVLEGTRLTADYWWDNVRQPVRFAAAIQTLIDNGCRVFVEIGPHAILQRYVGECLKVAETSGRVLSTLRRQDDGRARVEEAALRLHLLASVPDPQAYFPSAGRFVPLPNYPWQRERHWHPQSSEAYALIARHLVHPLLGWRLRDAVATWENVLDPVTMPYLADHRVSGAVVLPGTAYLELALAAGREWFGNVPLEIEGLDILAPIVFDGEHGRSVRLEFAPRQGNFRVLSRQRLSNDEWTINAGGRLIIGLAVQPPGILAGREGAVGEWVSAREHYQRTSAVGLAYGPAFQGFAQAHWQAGELIGEFAIPAAIAVHIGQYLLHPALVDAAFQGLIDFPKAGADQVTGRLLLPVGVGRLRWWGGGTPSTFRVALLRHGQRSLLAKFTLFDAAGGVLADLEHCRFRSTILQNAAPNPPACWQVLGKIQPHPVDQYSSPLPTPAQLVASAKAIRRSGASVNYYQELLPLTEATVVAFVHSAFKDLLVGDVDWMQGVLRDADRLDYSRRAYFAFLVRTLVQAGLLAEEKGNWRLSAQDESPPPEDIWRTVLAESPLSLPELLFVGRVGCALVPLLKGERDPEQFLSTCLASPQWAAWYDDAPVYAEGNVALREMLSAVVGQWPADRRLRILEISNGSSELPMLFADSLPAERVDYVIAVTEGGALAKLEAEYAGHPFILVASLTPQDMALSAKRVLPSQYDLVIIHHWLHRAQDLAIAVRQLRANLAAGGVLLIAERYPDPTADFVFGLDPCWWHGDLSNPLSSLMPPAAWMQILDEQGFAATALWQPDAAAELASGTYVVVARNSEVLSETQSAPADQGWLLVNDAHNESGLANQVAELLTTAGQRVLRVQAAPDGLSGAVLSFNPDDPERLAAVLAEARSILGQVDHVVQLGMSGQPADSLDPLTRTEERCLTALALVKALGVGTSVSPRLWLLTVGGALVSNAGEGIVSPEDAALWGLGRVIMNEYPALGCTLIDLDDGLELAELQSRLRAELLQPDGENEILLTRHGRRVLRMVRSTIQPSVSPTGAERFYLDFSIPGQLRNLEWRPLQNNPLAADAIEVRPAAVGLNFRDVMYSMGLLPEEAVENGFSGASLGLEFAGTVLRVGSAVTEYRPGDAVMGFGPACFASHCVTRPSAVSRKPDAWSFAEAATVPAAFFTVYYALKHLADVQPGERVLIHGAAGGVGIAAVQLARTLGAEIFATAGSHEKRDFVRLLGADHCFDSRSYEFADAILEATAGEGVDVVLNSLAGEAINRNLRVLKPFGRFLELGKRDFFENTSIGLRPFRNNISYYGIDADQLMVARPALAHRLFQEVMALFGEGSLAPLPYRVFTAQRMVDAFRFMQQSRQIGKVVVDMEGAFVPLLQPEAADLSGGFRRDASYLVTGGLAGFGLETARWMAAQGAGHLVLLGRRGRETPGVEQAVSELAALGAQVHVFACDVADRIALEAVMESVASILPPLRGVLHAAMVLDDGLIQNLDATRFHTVLAPKLAGAWNLHCLTRDLALDHFILYSTFSTYIGHPGQANYVAANGYLEGLATLRRQQGLPATCIGWGPIGDVGVLTRQARVLENVETRLGADPLTTRQALPVLGEALANDPGNLAVVDFSRQAMARFLPSLNGPRFAAFQSYGDDAIDDENEFLDIGLQIAGKSVAEVEEIVKTILLVEVAKILCLPTERIETGRSLYDLGMDSLMAVELALGIEKRFAITLPVMLLTEGPSVDRISQRIATQISSGADASMQEGIGLESVVSVMAVQHGSEVTDEEIAQTVAETKAVMAGEGVRLL